MNMGLCTVHKILILLMVQKTISTAQIKTSENHGGKHLHYTRSLNTVPNNILYDFDITDPTYSKFYMSNDNNKALIYQNPNNDKINEKETILPGYQNNINKNLKLPYMNYGLYNPGFVNPYYWFNNYQDYTEQSNGNMWGEQPYQLFQVSEQPNILNDNIQFWDNGDSYKIEPRRISNIKSDMAVSGIKNAKQVKDLDDSSPLLPKRIICKCKNVIRRPVASSTDLMLLCSSQALNDKNSVAPSESLLTP
ncbi:uncharacterized protein LOC142321091 [Lycorma delicatula]|uniref:uncharacterized protein LOC142321091 n=1 Tax=Lycorma delicatula TaxID=130591 RepID=UPI003F510911